MTRHEQAIERARDSLITVVYSADGPFSPKGQVLNLAARDAVVALMEAVREREGCCADRADSGCIVCEAMATLATALGVPE